ncbi:hypothetical protein GGR56DRAFT_662623 [Xylariaceae sp. FL0804]|nr:hypothetical protein GGR56DRAFT_662623 [Xylariaceae sp. FL0804]
MDTELDVDVNEDVLLNFDWDVPVNNVTADVEDTETLAQAGPAGTQSGELGSAGGDTAHKRYFPKRPHRKSRAGCKQCKKRKVKCDEARPACKSCTLRKENCVYPNASAPASATTSATLVARPRTPPPEPEPGYNGLVISEPLFIPDRLSDAIDMQMLWFYSIQTFKSFSVESNHNTAVDEVLKVKVVEYAFQSPFLMDTLMALASTHMQTLGQPVPLLKAASYRTRAFEGYRTAIESGRPADYPALLAQAFREPGCRPLYITEWMAVWRGIGLIVDLIEPLGVYKSGLSPMFSRPPMDLEKGSHYVPNNLLFMVTSIKPDDPDYEHQQLYYEFLRCLGGLYMELTERGFGPIMDIRIATFLTFLPRPLLPLASEHRPRILVILAYYLCFVKMLKRNVWWFQGVSDQLDQVCDALGDEWEHLIRVPRMVMQMTDRVEIARLVIDNHNWTPGELDLYHKNRDPRCETDLQIVDNEGGVYELGVYELAQAHWRLKGTARDVTWREVQVASPSFKTRLSDKTLHTTTPGSSNSPSSTSHEASSSSSTSATGVSPSASFSP